MPILFRVPKSQLLDFPCISIHLTWRVHSGNFIISVSYPLISGHFSWATSIHRPSVTPQRREPSKPLPRVSQANLAWTSATPKAARNSGHFPSHRAAGGEVIAGFHVFFPIWLLFDVEFLMGPPSRKNSWSSAVALLWEFALSFIRNEPTSHRGV